MNSNKNYTWEEAIAFLRKDSNFSDLIFYSYLSENLIENCNRFYSSEEFNEVLKIVKKYSPSARYILDLAAGNGIASVSFARSGFRIVALEPDPSMSVGRGAIVYLKNKEKLDNLIVLEGLGEKIPCSNHEFDVVYVRQALHHSSNLKDMLKEISRVLRPGGLLIATREHIVDNYEQGLNKFLNSHPVHKLYGGENAFTHKDYLEAISEAAFTISEDLDPYDSAINLYPRNYNDILKRVKKFKFYRVARLLFRDEILLNIFIFFLRKVKTQGRLHSFIAIKNK